MSDNRREVLSKFAAVGFSMGLPVVLTGSGTGACPPGWEDMPFTVPGIDGTFTPATIVGRKLLRLSSSIICDGGYEDLEKRHQQPWENFRRWWASL